ncbi:thawb [Carabus blaptoides fortunei]
MKRYLFLKLGIAILVCTAAASPRSQFSENFASNRDESRQKNVNQNGAQTTPDAQQGDTNNNLKDYQGVMGKPGVDFPVLTYIPRTKFTCRGKKSGYYADLETNCQVFHICDEGRKVSFLCPNGTIFQQSDLICDWWFKVDCASSPNLEKKIEEYNKNNEEQNRGVRSTTVKMKTSDREENTTSKGHHKFKLKELANLITQRKM